MIYNFDILAIAAVATIAATQVLKYVGQYKFVPTWASKYPRITTVLVSIGASVYAAYNSGFDIAQSVSSLADFGSFAVAVAAISAVVYNNLIKR